MMSKILGAVGFVLGAIGGLLLFLVGIAALVAVAGVVRRLILWGWS